MNFVVEQLNQNKTLLYNILRDVDNAMIVWKKTPDKWCLLEIVCHLYDEERDDFRFRTQWVLKRPNEVPPPFNPIDWISEHSYLQQDYSKMLNQFIKEREQSIKWLRSLKNPKWDNSFEHPKLGAMTAKYFLNNWLAHDYLHLRQITKLKFDYFSFKTGNNLNYAGEW